MLFFHTNVALLSKESITKCMFELRDKLEPLFENTETLYFSIGLIMKIRLQVLCTCLVYLNSLINLMFNKKKKTNKYYHICWF